MTCLTGRLVTCLLVLLCTSWLPPLRAGEPVALQQGGQAEIEPRGYGNCQWLMPHAACQEPALKHPPLASGRAVFYAAKLGDGADQTLTFIMDDSKGAESGYDTLYCDLNNDNVIDARTERFDYHPDKSSDNYLRIKLMITVGHRQLPYYVNFSAFPYNHPGAPGLHANLRNSSFYQGQADFAGVLRKLCILDLDSNGLYNDYQRGKLFQGDRLLIDVNGDGKFLGRKGNENESFPYGRYVKVAGDWYEVVIAPDGTRASVTKAQPAVGTVKVAPHVTRAVLVSDQQRLDIEFTDQSCEVLAGKYQLSELRMDVAGLALRAEFGETPPDVVVPRDGSVLLPYGPPLKVEPVRTLDVAMLQIELVVTGKQQERYQVQTTRRVEGMPGLAVLDLDGQIVAAPNLHADGRIGPLQWTVPKHYDGLYRLVPILDLQGVEHERISLLIRVVNGKITD